MESVVQNLTRNTLGELIRLRHLEKSRPQGVRWCSVLCLD